MSTKETGGPAFPVDRQTAHGIAVHEANKDEPHDEVAYIKAVARLSHGMTLRDYAELQVLKGLLANPARYEQIVGLMENNGLTQVEATAKNINKAKLIADAWMKARQS